MSEGGRKMIAKRLLIGLVILITVIGIAGISCSDDDNGGSENGYVRVTCNLAINIVGQGVVSPSAGSHTYQEGEIVTITAEPDSGWQFQGWSGDVNENSEEISVTMDTPKAITANFVKAQTLTINIVGQGVVSPAAGSHTYQEGEIVTITAEPDSGWQFQGWSGDVNENSEEISVTMDAPKTITANFVSLLKSNHLIFTMIHDDASPGYNAGNKVNIYFKDDGKFSLRDKFGSFTGRYTLNGNKLTLDFSSYPDWYVTFTDETHFTGIEAGHADSGTYEWVDY